jgi:Fic family protein
VVFSCSLFSLQAPSKKYQKINNILRETTTIDLKRLVKLGILKSSGTKGAGAFYELS